MCGIAGVFDASAQIPDAGLLRNMAGSIAHRGPDEEGFFRDACVGLASRRLKIIDLEGGAQPVHNETGRLSVVFNGEIYNFRELRIELRRAGHKFWSQTDTEVIVHLYEEQGEAFLTALRGMFAIALWDSSTRSGVLARDRVGKKPVVYAQVGERLYFASEIQALLQAPEIPREIDSGAVGDYLAYGYIPAPATIFKSIRKLPPGHLLRWERGQVEVSPYWRLRYGPKLRLDKQEALGELERRLDEAVRLRMVADVPLGALLSGGIDSSLIVALMARQSSKPVKTFSIGFSEKSFDELPHARRVAERYGTDHQEFVVEPDCVEVLPMLVRHYGEPFADASAIATFYVSKIARQHVTVALNGDGGDEDFAGYERYVPMLWADRLCRSRLGSFAGTLSRTAGMASPLRTTRGIKRFWQLMDSATLSPRDRCSRWMTASPENVIRQLLNPDRVEEIVDSRSRRVENAFETNARLQPLDRLLATDFDAYLPFDLLVKMDIASMATSLEVRSPLLDQEVVRFAALLPVGMKLRHFNRRKYLLSELARKFLPAENIDRPKMGFGVPVGKWLRGPLRALGHELLIRDSPHGLFRQEEVQRLWQDHLRGDSDWGRLLWALLMFELWYRECLLAKPVGVTAQPAVH